jgi:hypothetical protein
MKFYAYPHRIDYHRVARGVESLGEDGDMNPGLDPHIKISSAEVDVSPVSRARLRSIKVELAKELRLTARISPRRRNPPSRVSRPDSLPGSPASPMSPGRVKRAGLSAGFSVSLIVKNLAVILEDHERRAKRYFIQRLKRTRSHFKGSHALCALISKKILNRKFRGFNLILNFRRDHSQYERARPALSYSIFPVNNLTHDSRLPHLVRDFEKPSLRAYAGLGKLVGVFLAIHRYQKKKVLSCLINSTELKIT